jgi:hypothetical protein
MIRSKGEWFSETRSNKMHDVLELMAMCHNAGEQPLFLLQVLRVCRHALEPIQKEIRLEEAERELAERI